MADLTAEQFGDFYRAVYGYPPFPWQQRLLHQVLETGWPSTIDLPTASGKTACIDIAVFAMAVAQTGPRRIFFVVDRRVVVDAAFDRMTKLVAGLKGATEGILKDVASSLRRVAAGGEGDADSPLEAYQLRGGIYRDPSWVGSPLQPMVIASTVDQVGSRLLFRGYGLSNSLYPMHAALVANDSLLLLDEAHYSVPFAKTLRAVRRYNGREWGSENVAPPLQFVEMTATPTREAELPFQLDGTDDYENAVLRRRLFAPKETTLAVSKSTPKTLPKFAAELAEKALGMASERGIRRIAVMVNRVRTARLVHEHLRKHQHQTELLIGRMRPIDRLSLSAGVQATLSGQARNSDSAPFFVVATQCLEVGADLDFDALVTECASIDALQQRFGRLDRTGVLAEDGIGAKGCVVVQEPMTKQEYVDPIYGSSLSATWNWLASFSGVVDFGVASRAGLGETVRERLMRLPAADALRRAAPPSPTLLPTHLDILVQTSPVPSPDLDPHLFLHGKESGAADVQVVWRADLDGVLDEQDWIDIVAAFPPTSSEAMPVPLREFMGWWGGVSAPIDASDVEGMAVDEGEADLKGAEAPRRALRWAGDDSRVFEGSQLRIRPGDTLVLPISAGGWNELGHIPADSKIDVAEWARFQMRRPWMLRLHSGVIKAQGWPETPSLSAIRDHLGEEDVRTAVLYELIEQYRREITNETHWIAQVLGTLPKRRSLNHYPGGQDGWVLTGTSAEPDYGADESSSGGRISLEGHLADVAREAERFGSSLLGPGLMTRCVEAARIHDLGKADPRFQILLHGGDSFAARMSPEALAKGSPPRLSRIARSSLWKSSGLPDSFRHELVTLLLMESRVEDGLDDIALHLVASHHGRCRPFAPVVLDDDGPTFRYNGWSLPAGKRTDRAAHRIDSGIADRFWRLTRRFGWWGLAYLETIFRLADWEASRNEQLESGGEAAESKEVNA